MPNGTPLRGYSVPSAMASCSCRHVAAATGYTWSTQPRLRRAHAEGTQQIGGRCPCKQQISAKTRNMSSSCRFHSVFECLSMSSILVRVVRTCPAPDNMQRGSGTKVQLKKIEIMRPTASRFATRVRRCATRVLRELPVRLSLRITSRCMQKKTQDGSAAFTIETRPAWNRGAALKQRAE